MKKKQYDENKIIKKLGDGIESDVYLYNEDGIKTVIKLFKDEVDKDNKELKLELLSKERLILQEMKFLNRIYKDNKFIGYTTIYEPTEPFLNYMNKNKSIKIDLLNQLQDKYQSLNEKEIFIGDFNLENFRVKDGKLKLIDVDNFSIYGLDFDVKNPYMEDYFEKCSKIDNIDYYCFNYFTMSFIANILPVCLEAIIIQSGLPKEFNNEECKKIYQDLVTINDNYQREKYSNGNDVTLLKCMKKGLFK